MFLMLYMGVLSTCARLLPTMSSPLKTYVRPAARQDWLNPGVPALAAQCDSGCAVAAVSGTLLAPTTMSDWPPLLTSPRRMAVLLSGHGLMPALPTHAGLPRGI